MVATLKVKADKFKRMLNTGDEKAALVKFFEDEGCMRVYFVDGTKDMFCYTTAPASQKKKMMWMLKAEPGQISAKNIAASVMVGDLSPKLLKWRYLELSCSPKFRHFEKLLPYYWYELAEHMRVRLAQRWERVGRLGSDLLVHTWLRVAGTRNGSTSSATTMKKAA